MRRPTWLSSAGILFLLGSCYFCSARIEDPHAAKPIATTQRSPMPDNFKVAIIGDSGKGEGFARVLRLIKKEEAQMVLHLGDLAYEEGHRNAPLEWNQQVDDNLGRTFPYFILIGNHDVKEWSQYRRLFRGRLTHLPDATCRSAHGDDDLGIKSSCVYNELFFVLSGIGVSDEGHEAYIEGTLANNSAQPWKICAWHKNQRDMQTGTKQDEVGWKAYQICQQAGAIILTGHEHAYGRTRTLTALGKSEADHGVEGIPQEVNVQPGKTFVALSGTGGMSLRPWNCALHDGQSWWASVYSSNYTKINGELFGEKKCQSDETIGSQRDGEFGALFIEFNYQGNKLKARGRYLTTFGRVLDDFIITRAPSV
jgi:predicted phosphodiesterase